MCIPTFLIATALHFDGADFEIVQITVYSEGPRDDFLQFNHGELVRRPRRPVCEAPKPESLYPVTKRLSILAIVLCLFAVMAARSHAQFVGRMMLAGTGSAAYVKAFGRRATASLSANPTTVTSGGSSTLSWSSTRASSCISPGALGDTTVPSFPGTTSGSGSTGALTSTTTYSIQCGTATAATTVTVTSGGGDPTIGLLPSERDSWPNWKTAGLVSIGGIPTRNTQCGATVSPIGGGSNDTTNIQNAINACTAGRFVNLAAGTFTITEGNTIHINKGVTLRGQGAGVTLLQRTPGADTTKNACNAPGNWGATFGSVCPGNNPSPVVALGGGVGFGSPINLSSNSVVGSSSVQVTSATGISVGSLVNLDELGNAAPQPSPDWITSGGVANQIWATSAYDTVWNTHNPAIGSFDSAGCLFNTNNFSCGSTDPTAYSIRAGGVMEEYHLVSGVSGTTITFDSPVARVYHTANSAALTVFTPANLVPQAGLENVTVQYGDNNNVEFQGCIYCWLNGVESTLYLGHGLSLDQATFRANLTNFWVHEGVWPVNGGAGYNIALTYGTSENLIDNGISMKANKCIVMRASGVGTVVAYNYMDDQYIGGNASWVETCLNNSHLVGPGHNLFEGNWAPNADSDYTHGAVSYGTYYRNNLTGIRAPWTSAFDSVTRDDTTGCCSPMRAASSHPYTYWTSFIGNILGTPGVTTSGNGWDYQNNAFTNRHLLMLGWNDANVGGANVTGPDNTANVIYPANPTFTGTTGRFASSTGCISTTNCTTIVDGNYDYVNNTTTWDSRGVVPLTNSFYLSGAPSYFGTGYTWPPIDSITPRANEVPAHNRWRACQPTPTAACLFNTSTPQIAFTAKPSTISSGQSSTLTWASFNDTSCTGTGFSTGNAIYGSISTGALTTTTSYTVTCGGTAKSVTVTVNPLVASTWDPAHKDANITLSVSNTAATNSGSGGGNATTFSTQTEYNPSGKNYFELKCTQAGTNLGLGLQNNNTSTAYLGSNGNSVGYYRTNLVVNNGTGSAWDGCATGDTVGIMLDETVSPPQIYARVFHAGAWGARWNATTEAQPTSGGYSLGSSMTQGQALYVAGNPGDTSDSVTICTHSACGASPSGLPTGVVWFDGF